MIRMNVAYDYGITVEDYNKLREEVNWGALPKRQVQTILEHSLVMTAKANDEIIGSIRGFWDGGSIVYLCDIMVATSYQRRGIGTQLVNKMIDDYRRTKEEDWCITVVLLSAKGKEEFYQTLGFTRRPTEKLGAALTLRI